MTLGHGLGALIGITVGGYVIYRLRSYWSIRFQATSPDPVATGQLSEGFVELSGRIDQRSNLTRTRRD